MDFSSSSPELGDPAPPPKHVCTTEQVSNASSNMIQNLKLLNAVACVVTCLTVAVVELGRVRQEGVYGNEFLWMQYQTLVTPATYVNYIWVLLLLLQGLFIYASTLHPTLRHSPLVGYSALLSASPRRSVAVHYPVVCAATLLMVVSRDHGYVFAAFLWSVLLCYVLRSVLVLQTDLLTGPEVLLGDGDDGDDDADRRAQALRYAALRLPFELYLGHALALTGVYFNTFLHGIELLPVVAFVVVANTTLALLMGVGFWVLWRTQWKFYGVGAALVWYLFGVAAELRSPSQPIYNEFSDRAILATQIVAGVAALILATLLSVRVSKTLIKGHVFACGGDGCGAAAGEDEIVTDFVYA